MSRFRKRELILDDVEKELSIDIQRLNEELMDQPLFFRKWSKLLSEMRKKAKILALNLEEKEAELFVAYSNDGTGKKVKEVESAVALDAELRRLKRDLIDSEELVEQFEGILKAFYQKHEMLKDLSANKRKELM